jgi:multidrug efflux system outer membrane protein
MAAANKRIGVARTAFFPILNLTASGGFESTELSDLFLWSSRSWALGQLAGSAITMTIFDNGRNIARVDIAEARYQESVANYKTQVLAAFRDVEDALSGQRLLAEQSLQLEQAADAASRTTELTQLRYDNGDVTYFEVVDAQRNSLAAERAAVQTRGGRYLAAVALIRALGGGWDAPAPQPAPMDPHSLTPLLP